MTAVRSTLFTLSIFVLSASAIAQNEAHSSGLTVASFGWGNLKDRDFAHDVFSAETCAHGERSQGGDLVVTTREAYVQLSNYGAGDVRAVEWEYVFFADAAKSSVVKRYRFKTKQRIRPGETKFLAASVRGEAPSRFGQVRLLRVEYKDGSTWTGSEKEANESQH